MVKYGSEIFTEPDPSKKNKNNITRYVYVSALYNILKLMKGIRLFDRFGFILPNDTNKAETHTFTSTDYKKLIYHSSITDWINEQTVL
ncbi:MAG: hypothetical protein HQ541_05015 [Mariniphaga sp.]|nr:hypothetical protein [Mariniphaga sp.]